MCESCGYPDCMYKKFGVVLPEEVHTMTVCFYPTYFFTLSVHTVGYLLHAYANDYTLVHYLFECWSKVLTCTTRFVIHFSWSFSSDTWKLMVCTHHMRHLFIFLFIHVVAPMTLIHRIVRTTLSVWTT